MITYNKLIRDKIPEIMDRDGKEYAVHVLSNKDYYIKLKEKLAEELKEFNEAEHDEEIEELADMVEVIYAFVEAKGLTIDQFQSVRLEKKDSRGGFEKKLFLKYVK